MIAKDIKWTMNKAKEKKRQSRMPDFRDSGVDFGFTVSCYYSRIVWVSTLRCGGFPERKRHPGEVS